MVGFTWLVDQAHTDCANQCLEITPIPNYYSSWIIHIIILSTESLASCRRMVSILSVMLIVRH